MLTGLNNPYARHTGVRGLPVPLWRFGVSLLFAVVVVGRFISEFVLGLSPLYSRVLLLDNRQRRACLERDPVILQQFVGGLWCYAIWLCSRLFLWRVGVSLLFAVVVGGRFIRTFFF